MIADPRTCVHCWHGPTPDPRLAYACCWCGDTYRPEPGVPPRPSTVHRQGGLAGPVVHGRFRFSFPARPNVPPAPPEEVPGAADA